MRFGSFFSKMRQCLPFSVLQSISVPPFCFGSLILNGTPANRIRFSNAVAALSLVCWELISAAPIRAFFATRPRRCNTSGAAAVIRAASQSIGKDGMGLFLTEKFALPVSRPRSCEIFRLVRQKGG